MTTEIPRHGCSARRSRSPLTIWWLDESKASARTHVVLGISTVDHFGEDDGWRSHLEDAAEEILTVVERNVLVEFPSRKHCRQLFHQRLGDYDLVAFECLVHGTCGHGTCEQRATDPNVRVDYDAHASIAAKQVIERLLRESLGPCRRRDAVAEPLELRDIERG